MADPVGPAVSTVKIARAGAVSSSPPATAPTTNVCEPSARASNVHGDAHVESEAPSRAQSKLAPGVSEVANDSEVTTVDIATDASLGGQATLPDGPPEHARRVGDRETFLLRGRTLAEFIDRTKGEKWKALTEILGLDNIDGMRLDLQRARNDLRRAAGEARGTVTQRAEPLATRLKVSTWTPVH